MVSAYLELLDWRRQVSEIFASLRQRPADAATLAWFRAEKDALFRDHAQSPIPLPDRPRFSGLAYWPYDPTARVEAVFTPDEAESPADVDEAPPRANHSPARGEVAFHRIGQLAFELHGQQLRLGAFWIEGYAGGLFVPFKDETSGKETYGGGRYLLDTIKSADFGPGGRADSVVLDFNYAYHPSCAYDPRWVCPLAPPDSRLGVPVRAGEQLAAK